MSVLRSPLYNKAPSTGHSTELMLNEYLLKGWISTLNKDQCCSRDVPVLIGRLDFGEEVISTVSVCFLTVLGSCCLEKGERPCLGSVMMQRQAHKDRSQSPLGGSPCRRCGLTALVYERPSCHRLPQQEHSTMAGRRKLGVLRGGWPVIFT